MDPYYGNLHNKKPEKEVPHVRSRWFVDWGAGSTEVWRVLGFRGLGFWGIRVWGLGVYGLGFWGLGFRALGLRVWGFRVQGADLYCLWVLYS